MLAGKQVREAYVPEPLTWDSDAPEYSAIALMKEGYMVASVYNADATSGLCAEEKEAGHTGYKSDDEIDAEARATARRLVACYNACERIPTDVLEANGAFSPARVLLEVAAVRGQQDRRWGESNHPSVRTDLPMASVEPARRFPHLLARMNCLSLGIPEAEVARLRVVSASQHEMLTWGDLVLEQFSKAVCAPDDATRREKVLAMTALGAAWLECIDRAAEAEKAANPQAVPSTWETLAPLLQAAGFQVTQTVAATQETKPETEEPNRANPA